MGARLDKMFLLVYINGMKASKIISAVGVVALIGLFGYWWVATPGVSAAGRVAAVFSAALFGAVCLRFVPGWMAFWNGKAIGAAVDSEPDFMLPKLFCGLLAADLGVVLLVAALTAGLYAGSFIDWDSEDAQENPLAFLNQKETIRIWYGDEALP